MLHLSFQNTTAALSIVLLTSPAWAQLEPTAAPPAASSAGDEQPQNTAAPQSAPPQDQPSTAQPQSVPPQPVQQPQPAPPPAMQLDPDAEDAEDDRPDTLPYRPGPAPAGYALEKTTRKGFWIPGLAIFSASYISAVLAAQPSANNGTSYLYIPVAGPWITLSTCEDCVDPAYSLLALDGLMQVAGATLFTLGLSWKQSEYVRTYKGFSFQVTPRQFGRGSYGVGVTGTF